MILPILTHSQDTLNTDPPIEEGPTRDISYYRLGEFAKFVEHKRVSDSLVKAKTGQIKSLQLVIDTDQATIFQYEFEVVPALERRIEVKDSTITNQGEKSKLLLDLKDVQLKRQKNKKWEWLGGGALIGLILGVVFGGR